MDIVYWGNFILIPIAALELFLGIYILFRKPRGAVSVSFAIFCFAVALWVFGNGFGYINSREAVKWFWWNTTYISSSVIPAVFLYFSWYFPFKSKETKIKEYLLIILPTLIFSYFLIFSDLFIKDWNQTKTVHEFIYGPFYHIFAIYFIIFWLWAFVNLYMKYRRSDGIHRWQLKYLLVGVAFSSVFGITTNLILPWISVSTASFDYIGPGSSIIWLGMVSYIVWKR